MKAILVSILLATSIYAQQPSATTTQVNTSLVEREQTRLGYEPHNLGIKVEGIYRVSSSWVIVGYATALSSPKRDSGTGKSGFASLGGRWIPIAFKGARFFGEIDFIVGALNTRLYRKTIAHFRTGLGALLLNDRLLLEVSRLHRDVFPDAAKLLKERGFDPSALHTTFNQLSAWDYEGQYWHKPWNFEGKKRVLGDGIKLAMRISATKFVKNEFGERGRGAFVQFEVGPYWVF